MSVALDTALKQHKKDNFTFEMEDVTKKGFENLATKIVEISSALKNAVQIKEGAIDSSVKLGEQVTFFSDRGKVFINITNPERIKELQEKADQLNNIDLKAGEALWTNKRADELAQGFLDWAKTNTQEKLKGNPGWVNRRGEEELQKLIDNAANSIKR